MNRAHRSVARALSALLAAHLLAGCAYKANTNFGYGADTVRNSANSTLSIAVKPLNDERPPRKWSSYQWRLFLTYVPLIPYITIPYERLDETFEKLREEADLPAPPNFSLQIAEALASDLRESGIASSSFVIQDGVASEPAHLVLSGEFQSSQYDVHATSYGLGIAGVYFWILPIPIGDSRAHMQARLSLKDPSEREVWSCRLKGSSRALRTLYNESRIAETAPILRLPIHHFGKNDKGIDPDSMWSYHSDALRQAMQPCRSSLATFLDGYEPMELFHFTRSDAPPEPEAPADRLQRLQELLDQGLISPSEYQERRLEILDGI